MGRGVLLTIILAQDIKLDPQNKFLHLKESDCGLMCITDEWHNATGREKVHT